MSPFEQSLFLQLSGNLFLAQILVIAWMLKEGREAKLVFNKLMKLREKQ